MLWPLHIVERNAEVWLGGLQFYILFNSVSDTVHGIKRKVNMRILLKRPAIAAMH